MPNRNLGSIVEKRKLIKAKSDISVFEAAKIMSIEKVSSLLIVDNNHLRGIFTERDLLRRVVCLSLDPKEVKIKDVMTTEVLTLSSDKPLSHALYLMRINEFRHMPVLKNNVPIGIVSARDALGCEIIEVEKELIFENELFEIIG